MEVALMGAVATFSYPTFIARYPEFASVTATQAAAFFNEATVYCRNDGGGPVNDQNTQNTLLNMLTAHIAFLSVGTAAQPGPQALVGRISSASQGSVSVSAEMGATPGTAAWFMQTQYGAAYWQASSPYRSFRYAVRRGRYC
jgi:hypothetical protein